jgi:hypothetical protein
MSKHFVNADVRKMEWIYWPYYNLPAWFSLEGCSMASMLYSLTVKMHSIKITGMKFYYCYEIMIYDYDIIMIIIWFNQTAQKL